MKLFILLLLLISSSSFATTFSDLKFSGAQIADTQWNVGSCISSSSSGCQIYSKAPGPTWNLGYPVYPSSGQYISFVASGNSTYPWHMYLYNGNGSVATDLGIGKILSQGTASDSHSYFFFSNANYNGTLFSIDWGMNNTAGLTITGTMMPTVTQTDTFAANGSTTPLTSGQAYTSAPSLCCGGSSSSFSQNVTFDSRLATFQNRTTHDSKVYVEQIGDSNTITVQQQGTSNNYTKYTGNGYNNNINIDQSAQSSTSVNYTELNVNGNLNNVSLTQQGTGTKSALVTVSNNNNTVTLNQKDSGNQYAEILLSGGNKNVNVTQQGSGAHQAKIELSGQPTNLNLIQSGSTQQYYSVNFNCATSGGCNPIQVQQGN